MILIYVHPNYAIVDLPRPRKRLTELLYKSAIESKDPGNNKVFSVVFKRTPLQFLGNNKVQEIEFAINKLTGDDLELQKAVVTDEKDNMPCGLALRSIGSYLNHKWMWQRLGLL